MEKVFHIYLRNQCIIHSVREDQFESTWNGIRGMVGLMKTDYVEDDLSYEELTMNKEFSKEASY
jgi:hypothetical protein